MDYSCITKRVGELCSCLRNFHCVEKLTKWWSLMKASWKDSQRSINLNLFKFLLQIPRIIKIYKCAIFKLVSRSLYKNIVVSTPYFSMKNSIYCINLHHVQNKNQFSTPLCIFFKVVSTPYTKNCGLSVILMIKGSQERNFRFFLMFNFNPTRQK